MRIMRGRSLAYRILLGAVVLLTGAACEEPLLGGHSSGAQSGGMNRSPQSVGAAEQCRHEPKAFRCVKYLKNYDGDTITFNIPDVHPLLGKEISVRVGGIDTAEVRTKNDCEKKSARIARNLVENLLKRAKRIDLVNVERDKYFRVLADVIVDGRNLKDVLMRNGLAYEYEGKTKKKIDWCAVAKGDARKPAASKDGIGSWEALGRE